jgi:hypothetical protein
MCSSFSVAEPESLAAPEFAQGSSSANFSVANGKGQAGDFTPPLLYGQVRWSHLAIKAMERYGSYLSH